MGGALEVRQKCISSKVQWFAKCEYVRQKFEFSLIYTMSCFEFDIILTKMLYYSFFFSTFAAIFFELRL